MTAQIIDIPLNQIHPSKGNPRKKFDENLLKELAQSIRTNGVLQPILVRPNNTGFEIIAGERRWRASELAGLVAIPAIIRDDADDRILQMQIIENMQREGVGYFDEAVAIGRLRSELDLDVAEICKMLGKSDALIYQMLRLLTVPDEVKEIFAAGHVIKGVALLIAQLPNTNQQIEIANALKRERADRRISYAQAKNFIADRLTKPQRSKRIQQNKLQKSGDDFKANWKKNLLGFDCHQFERFKEICRGRTETDILAEAVDLVCREVNK